MKGAGRLRAAALALVLSALAAGCAKMGVLEFSPPVSPVSPDTAAGAQPVSPSQEPSLVLGPLFGDTLVGFQPGTGDSVRRYLGRLRGGYTADTLNLLIFGDNRPGFRTLELKNETTAIQKMLTLNPINWVKGLVAIPLFLIKGTIPDAKLWRDLPSLVRNRPNYGREASVIKALTAKIDSLEAKGQTVTALLNSGDLVKDGRYPTQWQRFLKLTQPLARRVPYFGIAGNHERTDDSLGLENWHKAMGLPIKWDRMYYCFDTADGWLRILALDSNPMTDPKNYWPREVEVEYSDEQVRWLERRLAEHPGPAIVLLHHPPYSLGFHRVEWQSDSMLIRRRNSMVQALTKSGLSMLVAGHEHAYERALLTCGDDVLIVLTAGGGGSPLHEVPTGARAGQMFAEYEVPNCSFKPENVFAAVTFHYVHARIWFGGGELFTYAVERDGSTKLIDNVKIDLKRWGIPKIDQKKIPIRPEGPTQPQESEGEKGAGAAAAANPDTAQSGEKLQAPKPAPRRRR